MAHKKGVGSSRNGRDSKPQYRGIKRYGGEYVAPGMIIIRQRGTQVRPGANVGMGRDYTIYSMIEGIVTFEPHSRTQKRVSVYPLPGAEGAATVVAEPAVAVVEAPAPAPRRKSAPKAEAAEAPAAPKAEAAPAAAAPKAEAAAPADQQDDLKVIEGIGPKIAAALNEAGITTFAQLAATDPARIEELLKESGMSRLADASTWPEQAALAAKGDWDGLKKLTESLKGGRRA